MYFLTKVSRNFCKLDSRLKFFRLIATFKQDNNEAFTRSSAPFEEKENKLYPDHIPTTIIQKFVLGLGSGIAAITDPYRHGKV